MKRILATLLAVCMMLSVLITVPFTVSAGTAVGYQEPTRDPANSQGHHDNAIWLSATKLETIKIWEVRDVEGLVKLAEIVNGGNPLAGVTIYQTADIDMSSVANFAGVGFNAGTYFNGTYDGQGYKITGLKQVKGASDQRGGLFSLVMGSAVIKNVYLDATCSFTSKEIASDIKGFGSLIGQIASATVTVENCYSAATVHCAREGRDSYVGGLIGNVGAAVTLSGLTFAGSVYSGALAGGICGYTASAGMTVSGCLNTGKVTTNYTNPENDWEKAIKGAAGGIVGLSQNNIIIENCQSSGRITCMMNLAAGAILGCQSDKAETVIRNCTASGILCGSMLGLVGYRHGDIAVDTSLNNVDATEKQAYELFPWWVGYQVTATYEDGGASYQDIRFVGSIDSLDYQSVGFNYQAVKTDGTVLREGSYTCQYVYEELYAEGGNLKASEICPGGYLFSVTLQKIPVSQGIVTFKLETFAQDTLANGGAKMTGESRSFTHVIGDKAASYTQNDQYKITLGTPTVVYQSPTNMSQEWGYYQFPRLYHTADGALLANWNYSEDTALGGGDSADAIKNAISYDGGKTWTPISDADYSKYPRVFTDAPTKNGNYFVTFGAGGSYEIPKEQLQSLTAYDSGAWFGSTFYVYLASDIAKLNLTDVNGNAVTAFQNPGKIQMTEYNPKTGAYTTSTKTLNWANMPVYGEIRGDSNTVILTTTSTLMAINVKSGMVEKDGVLYYATYTKGFALDELKADHHFGVYVFSSTDGGDTWNCISNIAYKDLPTGYDCYDGPCEPNLHVMPDGSLVIIARTGASNNGSKDPSVITRSTDNGKTWSKPQIFGSVGVLPQTLTLDCGVTIATYGRPGLFYRTTADASGQTWQAEAQITDLSPLQGSQDRQSCFYTGLYALDSDTALLIYADFNYPNGNGGYSKTIMVRTIDVVAK